METYFVLNQKITLEEMAEVMGLNLNKASACCCSPYFFTDQTDKTVALTYKSKGKLLVAFYGREQNLIRLARNIRFLEEIKT